MRFMATSMIHFSVVRNRALYSDRGYNAGVKEHKGMAVIMA